MVEFLKGIGLDISDVTGILVGVAALLVSVVAKFIWDRPSAEKDIEKISQTVQASAIEARARAIRILAEKLPADVTRVEFEKLFAEHLLENAGAGSAIASDDQKLVENLVTNYHQQALSQASVQFWFSVAAATIGFASIMIGAYTADTANPLSYAKVLPGVML